jgi:Rieske Fe-S protein
VPELKSGPAVSRRALVTQALAATGLAAAGIAGLARLTRDVYRPAASAGSDPDGLAPVGAARLADAVELGPSSGLRPGDSLTYRNPDDGSPDIAVRTPDGALAAFSALCTHAGCEVAYRGNELRCPCHGAVFDARDGSVKGGPAPRPLPRRRVAERDGRIYALPS